MMCVGHNSPEREGMCAYQVYLLIGKRSALPTPRVMADAQPRVMEDAQPRMMADAQPRVHQ